MAVAQTLEVLLRAVGLSQYTSDMGQAATATGRVGTEATSSFTTVGQKLQGAGQSLQEFGSTITPVSLAVAGLGSAATFVGANYDREFTKITTLVGVSADEVQRMKATTLDLAGETARAPQELASAMFTIQSAGLRGAEGAEALRIAAQGSAIGMGDTRDIAQALTGILNAYATSNITAAEAGDFLVATARAGNFEVSQLAGSLGRVLPIASAAGVELEDVGGSIALLTRNGLSASEAVTQTNAVLRGLVAPSQEAQQALDDAGLSFEDIRRIVQEQGLVAGIQALNEAAGGSQEQFVKLVGGSEAASAAFTILNADAGTIEGTFGAVAASAGLMEGAFGQLQESDAFRLDRALNEIKAEFTDFSQVVVPVAADALGFLSDAAGAASGGFRSLPSDVQGAAVGIGGLVAVAGPAAIGVGKLVEAAGALSTKIGAQGGLVASISNLNPLVLAGTAAVTAGAFAFVEYSQRQQQAAERAQELTDALATQDGTVPSLLAGIADLTKELDTLLAGADLAGGGLGSLSAETTDFLDRLDDLGSDGGSELFAALGLSIEEVLKVTRTGTDDFENFQGKIKEAEAQALKGRDGFAYLRDEIQNGSYANESFLLSLVDLTQEADGSYKSLRDLVDALDEQADAYDDVTKASFEQVQQLILLNAETGALSDGSKEASDNQKDLFLTALAGVQTYGDLQGVLQDLELALRESALEAEFGADQLAAMRQVAQDMGVPLEVLVTNARNAGEAIEDTGESAEDAIVTYETLADQLDAVAKAHDAVRAAADPYKDLLDATIPLSARLAEAQDEVQRSLNALADDGLERAKDGFNGTSDAAIANRDALREMADEAQYAILRQAALGESALTVKANQDDLRRAFIEQAVALGATSDEAEILADQYLSIPNEVITAVRAEGEDALQLLQDTLLAGESLDGFLARMGIVVSVGTDFERATSQRGGQTNAPVGGGVIAAHGALIDPSGVRRFAAGGFNGYSPDVANGHLPHVTTSQRLFGEPETGGEAYIPLANDWRRPRAQAIVGWLNDHFGMGPRAAYAGGGITPSSLAAGSINSFASGGLIGDVRLDGLNLTVPVTVNIDGAAAGGAAIGTAYITINAGDGSASGIASELERLCGEIRTRSTSSGGTFTSGGSFGQGVIP